MSLACWTPRKILAEGVSCDVPFCLPQGSLMALSRSHAGHLEPAGHLVRVWPCGCTSVSMEDRRVHRSGKRDRRCCRCTKAGTNEGVQTPGVAKATARTHASSVVRPQARQNTSQRKTEIWQSASLKALDKCLADPPPAEARGGANKSALANKKIDARQHR